MSAVDTMSEKVESILAGFNYDKGMLVSILQDIQAEYHYLPREGLERVSKSLLVPLSQVYGVATFFKAFSLEPRGRHLINVCLGTACHVRGAVRVLEGMERELGISAGETTKDLKFTLETVNCVGACALGPVVIVDGEYHGQMKSEKAKEVVAKYS
jgi:NADH-quinone oxidoreductase subunit E